MYLDLSFSSVVSSYSDKSLFYLPQCCRNDIAFAKCASAWDFGLNVQRICYRNRNMWESLFHTLESSKTLLQGACVCERLETVEKSGNSPPWH